MTRFPSCGLNVTPTVPLTTGQRGTVLQAEEYIAWSIETGILRGFGCLFLNSLNEIFFQKTLIHGCSQFVGYVYHIFKSRRLRNYLCSRTLRLHTVVPEHCVEDRRVRATSSRTAACCVQQHTE